MPSFTTGDRVHLRFSIRGDPYPVRSQLGTQGLIERISGNKALVRLPDGSVSWRPFWTLRDPDEIEDEGDDT